MRKKDQILDLGSKRKGQDELGFVIEKRLTKTGLYWSENDQKSYGSFNEISTVKATYQGLYANEKNYRLTRAVHSEYIY
jgi:hypothetical protein